MLYQNVHKNSVILRFQIILRKDDKEKCCVFNEQKNLTNK